MTQKPSPVMSLGHPDFQEAALRLAEREFGHLDRRGRTVRQDLNKVDWNRSVGLIDDEGRCQAFILAAPMDLVAYAASNTAFRACFYAGGPSHLNGLRGDAMVVTPGARHLAGRMVRRFLSVASECDYLWGTTHPALGKVGFWSRHGLLLGSGDDGEAVFALPMNEIAKTVLQQSMRLPSAEPERPRF